MSHKVSKKHVIKFSSLVLLIALFVVIIIYFNAMQYVAPNYLQEKVKEFGAFAPFVFIIIYSIATIFLIPGTILIIGGGLLFGTILGTIYSLVGAMIGAIIAFFIAKILGKDFIDSLFNTRFSRFKKYYYGVHENGLLTAFYLRVIPIMPFTSINYALGLTKIKFKDYFIGTFIGIVPATIVLAYFGESLASFNLINILISIFLLIILIFIFPIYWKINNGRKKRNFECK
ncbi:MAG: TVP38/TMEM64 family protein [Candidatus Pacearchaeota archaeon]|jgi:uncharacterized membrane protein YdjX (TVP38/TMEM64 family)